MTDPMTVLHDQWVADYVDGRAGHTTPGGLPYPDPTDPVNQGAAAFQALATALDPTYRAANDSATATLVDSTWSQLGCKTLEYSVGDITASGNGFAVTRAGIYLVTFNTTWSGGATSGSATIGVGKSTDAGPTAWGRHQVAFPLPGGALVFGGTWVRKMTAGETVVGFVLHNSGGTRSLTYRRLTINKIG